MTQKYIISTSNEKTRIGIENGELISIKTNKEELIHQKSNEGWGHSDIEMFPIIGPTSQNNFRVKTNNGESILDQHGLLRELNYKLIKKNKTQLIFEKKYNANTKIKNSKYPNKSTEEFIYWPYDFIFQKKFELLENKLIISFNIKSKEEMPFMLGYHPAFKLSENLDEIIKTKDKEFQIKEIIKAGNLAIPVLGCKEICLVKKKGTNIKIKNKGFNNFMLWSPSKNMICIEPITFYPYADKTLENGFHITKNQKDFEVEINCSKP